MVKYKLEVTVMIDELKEKEIINSARRGYHQLGSYLELDKMNIPPVKFIDDIQSALIWFVEEDPLLKKNGVKVTACRCGLPSTPENLA